jgi:hypothetical protein
LTRKKKTSSSHKASGKLCGMRQGICYLDLLSHILNIPYPVLASTFPVIKLAA